MGVKQVPTHKTAKHLRKNMTDTERKLWRHLRAKQLDTYRFRRQELIGTYVADFVCYESKLIVECDGGHHMDQIQQDHQRDEWFRSQGFKILRFWNNEVLTNIEGVLETIHKACLPPSPP